MGTARSHNRRGSLLRLIGPFAPSASLRDFLRPRAPLARRERFTLVELLVVVSIIAVLAALLLPALGGAKHSALRALCLANLKQQLVATAVYADANDGYCMPTYYSQHSAPVQSYTYHATEDYGRDWGTIPGFYTGLGLLGASGALECPVNSSGNATPDRCGALVCPAARWYTPTAAWRWDFTYNGSNLTCVYLRGPYFYRGMGSTAWPYGDTPRIGPRLDAVANRAAVYDTGYYRWHDGSYTTNHAEGYYNVAYFDGSAKGVPDRSWAKTRSTTYYGDALYPWFDQLR